MDGERRREARAEQRQLHEQAGLPALAGVRGAGEPGSRAEGVVRRATAHGSQPDEDGGNGEHAEQDGVERRPHRRGREVGTDRGDAGVDHSVPGDREEDGTHLVAVHGLGLRRGTEKACAEGVDWMTRATTRQSPLEHDEPYRSIAVVLRRIITTRAEHAPITTSVGKNPELFQSFPTSTLRRRDGHDNANQLRYQVRRCDGSPLRKAMSSARMLCNSTEPFVCSSWTWDKVFGEERNSRG